MSQILMLALGFLTIWQVAVTPQKVIPACSCYSLQVGPPRQTVKIGNPVRITVTVTNTVNHDIYVSQNSRHPGDLYFVDVKDANGVRPKMTDYYSDITNLLHANVSGLPHRPTAYRDKNGTVHIEMYRGSGEASRIVKPGGEVQYTILLNDLYVLNKAGTYTVQVKQSNGKGNGEIDSNIVTIKVTN